MPDCENCKGCGGCSSLELTQAEVELLDTLAQFAFLPVFRKREDMTPVYLEEQNYSLEEYSVILQLLEQKRLVSIDYGKAFGPAPGEYPVGGSVGLTQRGQMVVEQLQLQGIL